MHLPFLVNNEDATFARIFGRICDEIKQQPWIVVVYHSLEWKFYCKYVNSRQHEGTALLDPIMNSSSIIINALHFSLCW